MSASWHADGVLVIDKPSGMTSHDVVAQVRRRVADELGPGAHKRRGGLRVGHAGTLDPLASGVLVVMLGEGTKLAPWLTADDKRYAATVVLGAGTDTLDSDGAVVARAALPAELADLERAPALVEAALAAERARTEQLPPAFSAIRVAGRRAYDAARAGEELALEARRVAVRSLDLEALAPRAGGSELALALVLAVSKGYYVRALARDLGARLGVPAHLAALRRTASGAFDLAQACALDASGSELLARLVPTATAACAALPRAVLSELGAARARQGKHLEAEHFTLEPPLARPSAWLDAAGALVAVGGVLGGSAPNAQSVEAPVGWQVLRGFAPAAGA